MTGGSPQLLEEIAEYYQEKKLDDTEWMKMKSKFDTEFHAFMEKHAEEELCSQVIDLIDVGTALARHREAYCFFQGLRLGIELNIFCKQG